MTNPPHNLSLLKHYEDYKWIKVKSHKRRETHSWEDNYNLLERHHIQENTFLIDEVRKLAAIIDSLTEIVSGQRIEGTTTKVAGEEKETSRPD